MDACSLEREYIIPADTPRPTYARQCKALAAAKKEIPELQIPQSHVLQQTLKRLETAFVRMWERGFGFPRFKKVGQLRSFVFPQLNKDVVQGNAVNLPKIGWVKMHLSRPIPDGFVVKQATVVKRASGYYVNLSLQCDVSVPDPLPHGYPMGIDVGLEKFLATSEGELIPNPRFLRQAQSKLRLLQRMFKHKQQGSNRWKQLQHQIAKQHEKVTRCRKDFFFKLAHRLCDQAGMIFAEDLNLIALGRAALRKHTLDAAWGTFLNLLSFVCWQRGVYFAKVDSRGTSQICPHCGTNCGQKDLSVRVHHCPSCGYIKDRDVAAAEVVKLRGIQSTAGLAGTMLVEGKEIGVDASALARLSR